jgi:hypothetical protein
MLNLFIWSALPSKVSGRNGGYDVALIPAKKYGEISRQAALAINCSSFK